MGNFVLGLSVVVQLCATFVVARLAVAAHRITLVFLTFGLLLMACRRAITLSGVLLSGRKLDGLAEIVALCISVLMLLTGLGMSQLLRDKTAAKDVPKTRESMEASRVGLILLAVTIVGCLGVGLSSFFSSRRIAIASIENQGLTLAKSIRGLAEHVGLSTGGVVDKEPLLAMWNSTHQGSDGQYLCVIQNNRLVLHSADPDQVGADVGSVGISLSSEYPCNFSDLIAKGEDWAGPYQSPTGQDQLLVCAISPALGAVFAVHVPLQLVKSQVWAESLPWAIGLLMIALILVPFSGVFLYRAISRNVEVRRSVEREKQELESRLRVAQKMETLGTLSGGIAHDFNNILTPILGYLDLMKTRVHDPSVQVDLEHIEKAALRATSLTRQILLFSQQRDLELRPTRIQDVVRESYELLRATIPTTIELRLDIDDSCPQVAADPSQIHRVMMNLGTNAHQALKAKGGVISIELRHAPLEKDALREHPRLSPGHYAILKVEDNGEGMDSAIRERVFEPFFTTKPVTEGTGLGMSVVFGIIKSHGGGISVQSQVDSGTSFTILLPVHAKEAPRSRSDKGTDPTGSARVLFVDDDMEIVKVAHRELASFGYRVTSTDSSSEALAWLSENKIRFDVLVTDAIMQAPSGMDLASAARAINRSFPVVVISGTRSPTAEFAESHLEGVQSLLKPFTPLQLAEAVREAYDRAHPPSIAGALRAPERPVAQVEDESSAAKD